MREFEWIYSAQDVVEKFALIEKLFGGERVFCDQHGAGCVVRRDVILPPRMSHTTCG